METTVSSAKQTVIISPEHPTRIIGERINPTGRKKFAAALAEGDLDIIRRDAIAQVEAGADILDVNVGAAGVDEISLMPQAVQMVMEVTDAPLSIDSSNPAVIQAGLEAYEGKALVNSVNGEEAAMAAILPLVAEHGAAVIGLCMDDDGIPSTPEARLAVARKLIARAGEYGIPPEDILIDPLVLTVGSDTKAASVTLETARLVRAELGMNMTMGASNVSFGLPNRPAINASFLTMGILRGVNAPISNPMKEKETVLVADLLMGKDDFAMNYIAYFRAQQG